MGRFDAKRQVIQRLSAHRHLSRGDTLVSRLKDADGHECVNGSFGRTLSRRPDDPSPKSAQITPRPRSAFISQESPLRVMTDKTQSENNESALPLKADVRADIR
jgi:hypothetical protein